jgi:hypothetical protein
LDTFYCLVLDCKTADVNGVVVGGEPEQLDFELTKLCVWMWQQIKVASVKLARVYMTRVAAELEHLAGSDREPVCEFLLLQGVRYAFRVHQVQNSFLSF